jgi:DNA invertase Pin-like site-specific DNA recombinase
MEQQGYLSNDNLTNASNGKAYNAAQYMRFSKDDGQLGDSSSIETQRLMLEKFCKDNGYKVYSEYIDDGYSGLNFERPGFKKMLKDIEDGKVNLVITKDQSRLGRDYIQTGYITEVVFGDRNVRYIAINDGADTANPANSDFMPFRNIINNLYSKDLSRKVKSAKRQRAISGKLGRPNSPYGYRKDPNDNSRLVIDAEAAVVVRRIFRMVLEGKGHNTVAKALTKDRVLTPSAYKTKNGLNGYEHVNRGKSEGHYYNWGFVTMRNILHDRVYVGDTVSLRYEILNYRTRRSTPTPKEKHIVIKDTHEPIVSRDDFERVQQLMVSRHRQQKRYNVENIFRGLIFCVCGRRMTINTQKLKATGKTLKLRSSYRCQSNYFNPLNCERYNYIYYENLYEQVLQSVKKVLALMKDDEAVLEIAQRKTAEQADRKKLLAEKNKHEKRLSGLTAIIRKLYEDYSAGALAEKNYLNLLADYQAEQGTLDGRLAVINGELAKTDDYHGRIAKLREIAAAYSECTALTAEMLNQLIERIEIGYPITTDNGRKVIRQEISIIYRFINTNL